MNIHEKNLILNFKKQRKQQQRLKDFTSSECTFQPQLNPKSLKMAAAASISRPQSSQMQHHQPDTNNFHWQNNLLSSSVQSTS